MFKFMKKDFKIVEKSKIWFALSLAIIVVGIVLVSIFGFNLGIEFAGGTQLSVKVDKINDQNYDAIFNITEAALSELKLNPDKGQKLIYNNAVEGVKFGFKNEVNNVKVEGEDAEFALKNLRKLYEDGGKSLTNAELNTLKPYYKDVDLTSFIGITERIHGAVAGSVVQYDIESVSPTASNQLFVNALIALSIAMACILVYIIIRFRKLGGMRAGLAAIIGLVHNVLIMLSFMVIFGLMGLQINSTFVAAVVTIVAYSINDTIVLFDRVRENEQTILNAPKTMIANLSIKQVLGRTLFTSLTTLFAVFALTVLGVPSVREFTLPILVGLIAGTYASIFISTPLWALFAMMKGKNKDKTQRPKENKA